MTPATVQVRRRGRLAGLGAALVALAGPAPAAAGVFDGLAPDTDWTLFHPTPRAELRALADETTARTVDAGHLQLDLDVFDGTWDRGATVDDRRLELFALTARLGLTRRTDLQLVLVPYREAGVVGAGGATMPGRGLGDTTVRLGLNLWGNDGGVTAAALVPFVRLPTATGGVGSGAVEGGVTVPVTVTLPGALEALALGGVELADDRSGRRGVHPRMTLAAALARHVAGPVSVRAGWTTTADAEGAVLAYDHELAGDGAVALGRDLQLRAGVRRRVLVERAPLEPYLRVSYRR